MASNWAAALRRAAGAITVQDATHGFGGAALGAAVSWVVNCTLVEVSLSPFFSFYFGVLFVLIGAVIAWRVKTTAELISATRVPVLYGFAGFVVFCGGLCFVLDEHWFTFSRWWKVPLYTALGVSVCFAFTFSSLDLLNWIYAVLVGGSAEDAKSLIESPEQVHLVLVGSLTMGAVFGLIFGIMDVEDAPHDAIRAALIHEEHFCLPFGFACGMVTGILNARARKRIAARQQTEDFVRGPRYAARGEGKGGVACATRASHAATPALFLSLSLSLSPLHLHTLTRMSPSHRRHHPYTHTHTHTHTHTASP